MKAQRKTTRCNEKIVIYGEPASKANSRRPDLDESVILDCLEGKVYKNDRQVKAKHIFWGLDKENPRAEIEVSVLEKN